MSACVIDHHVLRCIFAHAENILEVKHQSMKGTRNTLFDGSKYLFIYFILQDDSLAPFLFIIVIDYILKKIPNEFGIITHQYPFLRRLNSYRS